MDTKTNLALVKAFYLLLTERLELLLSGESYPHYIEKLRENTTTDQIEAMQSMKKELESLGINLLVKKSN